MASFGIDFGTTNSVLAFTSGGKIETVSLDEPPVVWAALGFDKVLPSVIAHDSISGEWSFGWKAKVESKKPLSAVKRLLASEEETVQIGSETISLEEAAASLFREIQKKASESGLTLDHAVVTIPANSRGTARLRTRLAAGLAGIEVPALINEPTAAAMAYGQKIMDTDRVLVFDFGGGTLDVTILKRICGVFMEEASKGVSKLGGIDIDEELAKAVARNIPGSSRWMPKDGDQEDSPDYVEFLLEIEMAKIKLSTQESHEVNAPDGVTVRVTRQDLGTVLQPLLQRARGPIDTCIKDLGGSVEIDHLVLVGGSSKIPAVRDFVAEVVGQLPMEGVDPMTAIAEGAALAASILADENDDLDFFVGTEHALGTVILDRDTKEEIFSVLIPRNRMLPAEATDWYSPVVDYEEHVKVRVIEGDPELPLDHEDNVILREWRIDLIDPKPANEASISIQYRYDVDGILHVVVRDGPTNVVLMDEQLSYGAPKRDLAAMKRNLDRMASGSGSEPLKSEQAASKGLDAESQGLVDKVSEKIIPFVDEDEQDRLNAIIADLMGSSAETLAEAKRRLGAAMREHAYLL